MSRFKEQLPSNGTARGALFLRRAVVARTTG